MAEGSVKKGPVRANAPARRRGRGPLAAHNAETEEARQSLPLFQLIAQSDPPRGDDVRLVSAVAAER